MLPTAALTFQHPQGTHMHATPRVHIVGSAYRRGAGRMRNRIIAEVAKLRLMTIVQLRQRYAKTFGQESINRSKEYLWKRIAYHLQQSAREKPASAVQE